MIGYDDLLFTIPGTTHTVKLQSGEFWQLSCSTKLEGEVDDIGSVIAAEGDNNTTVVAEGQPIDFSLDIMCCDQAEANCDQEWLFLHYRIE